MGSKGDHGKPLEYDPNFNGPLQKRSCTDILCLLVFVVFVGCWIALGIFAFKNGDPNTILVPRDSSGSRCGIDSHVADKPYLFFFDLTKCAGPQVPFTGCKTPQVCVKKCPEEHFYYEYTSLNSIICLDGVKKPTTKPEAKLLVESNQCAPWHLKSQNVLKRCLYDIKDRRSQVPIATVREFVPDEVANYRRTIHYLEVFQNVIADVRNNWWTILAGLAFAMLVCLIYIVMMRWIAGIMVWLSIVGVIALLGFSIYYSATKYKYLSDHPDEIEYNANASTIDTYLAMKDTWLWFLIICSVLLGIILLVLLFLRSRIRVAIALIKEGSKAVSASTSTLLFPIFPWIFQMGVIAFAVGVAVFLTTVGEPSFKLQNYDPTTCVCKGAASTYMNNSVCEPDIFRQNCHLGNSDRYPCTEAVCRFIKMNNAPYINWLQAFNVFGFFWGVFFISALGQMILASTFATWYWTFDKSDVPFFTLMTSVLRVFRYHIGTVAFGSLIIAICRIIRVILEYVDHKLKKYDNAFVRAILCCMKCFFWCLEKFLKFINKNAYIMCAIHGKNFCTSAGDAFSLLMRNIVRVFVLDKVTDFLFFLGKVLITVGVGCIAYEVFATDAVDLVDKSEFNYNLVPVIIIMIGTYFVASVFFSVYAMAVDTLFLCFLEDSERNDGSQQKPYFMSKRLMKILGKKNK